MSELKEHLFCECDECIREYRGPLSNEMRPYYLRSDVDRMIAILEESHKMEVEQLLILNREQANAANRLRDSMEQAIFHQKYKRCLAMVRICKDEAEISHNSAYEASEYLPSQEDYFRRKAEHYERWQKRWLELAEKFKEAK